MREIIAFIVGWFIKGTIDKWQIGHLIKIGRIKFTNDQEDWRV